MMILKGADDVGLVGGGADAVARQETGGGGGGGGLFLPTFFSVPSPPLFVWILVSEG